MGWRARIGLIGIPALAVAGAAAWYVAFRPIDVVVAAPQSDILLQVFGLGTVEARVVSRIGFEIAGSIVELSADAGERVRAGQVLARLDGQEAEARLAQAQAGLSQAEAAFQQASAALPRVRATLRQRQQSSERRQELVRRGAVSTEAAQEAQLALDVAAADVAQATSAVDVANANVQQARATLALETARLDKHMLRARYDALVVTRHRELGATVNPGEPTFTIIDPATVWVLAYVDEAGAGRIAVGQPAEIRLRSLPGQSFAGRVARIDIESDRVTEERRVYATCERCPPAFFLGEQAEVTITVGRLDRATLVPRAAVALYRGTTGRVWTVEDGRLAQRDVAFGARTIDGRLEIVSGLPDGAAVVTAPRDGLREGRQGAIRQGTVP